MIRPLLLILVFIFSNFAFAAQPTLQQIRTKTIGDNFIAEYEFDRNIEDSEVDVEYINRTVQLNIKDAKVSGKKRLDRVGKNKVKSVYTYQPRKSLLRSRIIYHKPVLATDLRGSVEMQRVANVLTVTVSRTKRVTPPLVVKPPFDLSSDSQSTTDKELTAQEILEMELAELDKKVNESKKSTVKKIKKKKPAKKVVVAAAASTKPTKDKVEKPESEVPVFASVKKEKESSSSAYVRVLVSLFLVIAIGFGLTMFGRWWSKRHRPNELNAKMQLVSQFHLGPKKQLSIVRVAGEYILLGVTDQNINMIKSLSFIDDEVPADTPQTFSEEIDKASAGEIPTPKFKDPEQFDEFSLGSIRDSISTRLKDMRPLG